MWGTYMQNTYMHNTYVCMYSINVRHKVYRYVHTQKISSTKCFGLCSFPARIAPPPSHAPPPPRLTPRLADSTKSFSASSNSLTWPHPSELMAPHMSRDPNPWHPVKRSKSNLTEGEVCDSNALQRNSLRVPKNCMPLIK